MYVSLMTVALASLFALPLAYLTTRFEFRGAVLIRRWVSFHSSCRLSLAPSPCAALRAQCGSGNLLLDEASAFHPLHGRPRGVIFVEGLHSFRSYLINLWLALGNIDSSMEESRAELAAHGLPAFPPNRVPSAWRCPALSPAPALVFVKVFDDLATPLVAERHKSVLRRRPICASPRSAWRIRWLCYLGNYGCFRGCAMGLSAKTMEGKRVFNRAEWRRRHLRGAN